MAFFGLIGGLLGGGKVSRTTIENTINIAFKTHLETQVKLLAEEINSKITEVVNQNFFDVRDKAIVNQGGSQMINITDTTIENSGVTINLGLKSNADLSAYNQLKSNINIEVDIIDKIISNIEQLVSNKSIIDKAIDSANAISNDKTKLTEGEMNNIVDKVMDSVSAGSDINNITNYINQQFETIVSNRIEQNNVIRNLLQNMVKNKNDIISENICKSEQFNSQIININKSLIKNAQLNFTLDATLQNIVLCKSYNIFNNTALTRAMTEVTSNQISKINNETNVKEAYTISTDVKTTISDKTTSIISDIFRMVLIIGAIIVGLVVVGGGAFLLMGNKGQSAQNKPKGSSSPKSSSTPNLTNTPTLSGKTPGKPPMLKSKLRGIPGIKL